MLCSRLTLTSEAKSSSPLHGMDVESRPRVHVSLSMYGDLHQTPDTIIPPQYERGWRREDLDGVCKRRVIRFPHVDNFSDQRGRWCVFQDPNSDLQMSDAVRAFDWGVFSYFKRRIKKGCWCEGVFGKLLSRRFIW